MKDFLRGATLVELLVTIAISGLIFSLVIVGWRRFHIKRQLRLGTQRVENILRLIRAKALHGEKPDTDCPELIGYKVNVDSPHQLSWWPVCSDGKKEEEKEKTIVQIEEVSLSGENFPIQFFALTGKITKEEAKIVVTTAGTSEKKEISISSAGLISSQEGE